MTIIVVATIRRMDRWWDGVGMDRDDRRGANDDSKFLLGYILLLEYYPDLYIRLSAYMHLPIYKIAY